MMKPEFADIQGVQMFAIDAADDRFLSDTRIGILTTNSTSSWPVSIPIWYEWDGETIQMFSGAGSAKVRRLQRDPHASLMVANTLEEPENWVAVDGTVSFHGNGAFELAERLAGRYWDMTDAGHLAVVDQWREAAANLIRIVLTPSRIRHHG